MHRSAAWHADHAARRSDDGLDAIDDALADPADPRSVAAVAKFRASAAKEGRASLSKQLIASSQRDQPSIVRCLVDAGADVESRWGPTDGTPLLHAAEAHCPRVVRVLLAAGASLRARTSAAHGSLSPLHAACRTAGGEEVVGLLLEAGANANAKSGQGFTPLQLAAGADPLATDPAGGNTALHAACLSVSGSAREREAVIAALVRAAPQALNQKTTDKSQTPLHQAATAGNAAAVRALLAAGADAGARDGLGNTPLFDCIGGRHAEALKLLLPASNIAAPSATGRHAFLVCVVTGWEDGFQLFLPFLSGRIDLPSEEGRCHVTRERQPAGMTALLLAAHAGHLSLVRALLKAGACRTAADARGTTPLHVAAASGQLSCLVAILGKPGAYKLAVEDVCAADRLGYTALHQAASAGEAACCGVLMAAGASAVEGGESSPLAHARAAHPQNKALLDLLEGKSGAAPIPGVSCGFCTSAETPAAKLRSCSSCHAIRYCPPACAAANWAAHKAACKARKAELEAAAAARVRILGPDERT